MQCPYYYANYECLECHSLQDCEEWPYKMTTQAPNTESRTILVEKNEGVQEAVIVIPLDEWNSHKARVEQLVALLNGVIRGLAGNPLMLSMLPPDIVAEMQKVE
jgi:hypothetical protein